MKKQINGRWCRVIKDSNIWTSDINFFPEERWMFLWWRIGDEYQVHFKEEDRAWSFLENYFTRL